MRPVLNHVPVVGPGLPRTPETAVRSVAAIVYPNEAYPDALFRQLVAACRAAGIVAAGVLQHSAPGGGNHRCDVYLEDLASGHLTRLFENRGSEARGCRLDESALAEATSLVEKCLQAEPGLLVLNKFGKAECEGKGTRDLIASAIVLEVPVVIGVPARNLEAWREFAGEFAVELRADFVEAMRWLCEMRTEEVAERSHRTV